MKRLVDVEIAAEPDPLAVAKLGDVDVRRPGLRPARLAPGADEADRDHAVVPERGRQLAAAIPGARYVSLPSANHLMLEDEPAWSLFVDELGQFLNW